MIFRKVLIHQVVHFPYSLGHVINVIDNLEHQLLLQRCEESIQRLHDALYLVTQTATYQGRNFFLGQGCIALEHVCQQVPSASAVDVRHYAGQFDVAAFQHLLETVQLTGTFFDETFPITG